MNEIRTHRTTVGGGASDMAFLPAGWAPKGTPVLVVAGLPENADIRDVNEALDGKMQVLWPGGHWGDINRVGEQDGPVICRPAPPAPPVKERIPWHDAIVTQRKLNPDGPRIAGIIWTDEGLAFTDKQGSPIARFNDPAIGWDGSDTVEVLVERTQ